MFMVIDRKVQNVVGDGMGNTIIVIVKKEEKFLHRRYGKMEITAENGYLLVVDENGNGEPFFDVRTKEGKRNKKLWKKLNKENRLWEKFKKKFCER